MNEAGGGLTGGPHGAAFSGRVGWGTSPAVLVVDLVRAYTEPDGPFALPCAAEVLAATSALVGAARADGVPVLWTVVRYPRWPEDAGLFGRKVPALAAFADGASGGWGALALDPAAGETVLAKRHASAFHATTLPATLQAAGVDTLVIAGVSTSGCVRATATDANAHGLHAQVVREACGDRSPDVHEGNLADLDAKYADVIDLAAALAHLTRLPGAGRRAAT